MAMELSGRQILMTWAAGALLVTALAAATLRPLEAQETVARYAGRMTLDPPPAGANLYYLSNQRLRENNQARQVKALAAGATAEAERRLTLFFRISGTAALSTLVAAGVLAIVADSGAGEREARRASIIFRRQVGRRRRARGRENGDDGSPTVG
ncbi:MAG: hypothetical protein EA355_12910 [Rhodobacteraceae bacterium]|nr:MAG: hypothetical protein EA355_12910 [Paracoccaceae bacterium]